MKELTKETIEAIMNFKKSLNNMDIETMPKRSPKLPRFLSFSFCHPFKKCTPKYKQPQRTQSSQR
jgi:hypothetical protein